MIVTTVLSAIFIIPLCWLIPMTIATKNSIDDFENSHIALGICSILFCGIFGIVAGILMLCTPGIQTQQQNVEHSDEKEVENKVSY